MRRRCMECVVGKVASSAALAAFLRAELAKPRDNPKRNARLQAVLVLVGLQLPGRCLKCSMRMAKAEVSSWR